MDHAWTCDSSSARGMLTSVDGLLDRMCKLMDIDDDTEAAAGSAAVRVQAVLDKMWMYNQTYSVAGKQLVCILVITFMYMFMFHLIYVCVCTCIYVYIFMYTDTVAR